MLTTALVDTGFPPSVNVTETVLPASDALTVFAYSTVRVSESVTSPMTDQPAMLLPPASEMAPGSAVLNPEMAMTTVSPS